MPASRTRRRCRTSPPISRVSTLTDPASSVTLLPWDDSGLDLLRGLNTAGQKRYLGGPESETKTLDRHRRYLTYHQPGEVEMLMVDVGGELAGSVGYWECDEAGARGYEMGWELLASFHGRGLGSAAAAALLGRLRPIARHRYVYAYPTPENAGSNGICRKLDFAVLETRDFEYPVGIFSPHNVWRLDLTASAR